MISKRYVSDDNNYYHIVGTEEKMCFMYDYLNGDFSNLEMPWERWRDKLVSQKNHEETVAMLSRRLDVIFSGESK